MKNRKVIVTAFLLIAVMVLGVGYAAVSDILTFGGQASVNADELQTTFDNNIKITAVAIDDTTTWVPYTNDLSRPEINSTKGVKVNIYGSDETAQDHVEFSISHLIKEGDSQVLWFKVANASDNAATLAGSVITESGEVAGVSADYFSSEYKIYSVSNNAAGEETTSLPKDGEVWVMLKITLHTVPNDAYTATFNFTITATANN